MIARVQFKDGASISAQSEDWDVDREDQVLILNGINTTDPEIRSLVTMRVIPMENVQYFDVSSGD